jgi:hypothetical protein
LREEKYDWGFELICGNLLTLVGRRDTEPIASEFVELGKGMHFLHVSLTSRRSMHMDGRPHRRPPDMHISKPPCLRYRRHDFLPTGPNATPRSPRPAFPTHHSRCTSAPCGRRPPLDLFSPPWTLWGKPRRPPPHRLRPEHGMHARARDRAWAMRNQRAHAHCKLASLLSACHGCLAIMLGGVTNQPGSGLDTAILLCSAHQGV